ncbi:MAG: Isoquinoline 1-oxidoreductase subunit [Hyalangium sp.]|uniref:Isoquinoline 1-oxidoreductase subunit n=1 Tax=Hyalangium sp. TaxID=2028555 RepID=UPI00389B04DD
MPLLSMLVLLAVTQAPTPPTTTAGSAGHPFDDVARVLMHPRCMNCHPAGDRPLQKDTQIFHKQNVSRRIDQLGHACTTCHPAKAVPGANLPPGAPHWHMPSARTPMVFEKRTPQQLCEQLKDPATNGNRTLAQLRTHMAEDSIVKWGFSPGEGRTVPPLTHDEFIQRVDAWLAAGAPCPQSPPATAPTTTTPPPASK